ncbi:alpha/beta hydrolase family esterase [Luteipulveratus mongoliensis]|uniref:Poly(3-hydroxybutyrate) depolymerase n=1 Tax=Luteipulveratus mongoliensis TaxID=571913 RepID=A0A0K1JH88_9MICO|nr:poly(3-hydroxybutyrate) depolymerase [Luteipulveratus mongoliensis]AKU16066.1 poly(3-hydroxybutyrate) depolymerase [Luteipulveratus mongoliensis]
MSTKTSRLRRTVVSTFSVLALSAAGAGAATAESASAPTGSGWSTGCGIGSAPVDGQHTVSSGGRARTYELHLPAGYRTWRAWPVVIAYHGRGNTGAGTQAFSGLDNLPAIVVYPNGVIGTGDGERQAWEGAPYSAPGVDDVAFTGDLLDSLESDLCVDTRRVYATGKSNGAGFTGILACELSDRITAIAPVSGAFYPTGRPCNPSRRVPVIDFHGTADTTIPYAGDADRGLPAIRDWVGAWADRDGCRTRPHETRVAYDVARYDWHGCRSGSDVAHVAVVGGGHTWPGEDSYSGGGYATHSIEAHDVMWTFLRGQRLPRH